MRIPELRRPILPARPAGPAQGVTETTERIRELVDGLEAAIAARDDLELSRFLAPPALGRLLAHAAELRSQAAIWRPGRSGLRWGRSSREPSAPGRFWLRLRFEDRSLLQTGTGQVAAPPSSHEVEVELETTQLPWRLCQAEEVFSP